MKSIENFKKGRFNFPRRKTSILPEDSQKENEALREIVFVAHNEDPGLSQRLFNCEAEETFEVKPFTGKGLCLQSEGIHIAFTSGSGSLVILDLAALLLKAALGEVEDTSMPFLAKNSTFKLIIYASYKNEEDYIGLELLEGLEHITKEKNLKNFELMKCKGEASTERWNYALIE